LTLASVPVRISTVPDPKHDDHELAVLKAEDHPIVARSEAIAVMVALQFPNVAMPGFGVAIESATYALCSPTIPSCDGGKFVKGTSLPDDITLHSPS
jgi:hypothetical protein